MIRLIVGAGEVLAFLVVCALIVGVVLWSTGRLDRWWRRRELRRMGRDG